MDLLFRLGLLLIRLGHAGVVAIATLIAAALAVVVFLIFRGAISKRAVVRVLLIIGSVLSVIAGALAAVAGFLSFFLGDDPRGNPDLVEGIVLAVWTCPAAFLGAPVLSWSLFQRERYGIAIAALGLPIPYVALVAAGIAAALYAQ
jgi:hypothetical protein